MINCARHEEARATHAVQVKGEPGLISLCCACAESHNRCTH